jgi:hypothetical protein
MNWHNYRSTLGFYDQKGLYSLAARFFVSLNSTPVITFTILEIEMVIQIGVSIGLCMSYLLQKVA